MNNFFYIMAVMAPILIVFLLWCEAADKVDKLTAKLAAMKNHAKALDEFASGVFSAQVSSGSCCCGSAMDRHESPMHCGHSAVDEWSWFLELSEKKLGLSERELKLAGVEWNASFDTADS